MSLLALYTRNREFLNLDSNYLALPQVLAVRRQRPLHQGLGPREQEPCGGSEAGGAWLCPRRASPGDLPGLVC